MHLKVIILNKKSQTRSKKEYILSDSFYIKYWKIKVNLWLQETGRGCLGMEWGAGRGAKGNHKEAPGDAYVKDYQIILYK